MIQGGYVFDNGITRLEISGSIDELFKVGLDTCLLGIAVQYLVDALPYPCLGDRHVEDLQLLISFLDALLHAVKLFIGPGEVGMAR